MFDESTRSVHSRQALVVLRATLPQQLAHAHFPLGFMEGGFPTTERRLSDAERAAAETLLMMPTPEEPNFPARRFSFAAQAPPALAWDAGWPTPIRA